MIIRLNLPFQIITPFRRLMLCAENRKEMEDWISSLKSVQSREPYEVMCHLPVSYPQSAGIRKSSRRAQASRCRT